MSPWLQWCFRKAELLVVLAACVAGCTRGTEPPRVMRPQTVVLFATPKFIADFEHPDSDVTRFLLHYAPLSRPASETIVIFAVGNSQHILTYRGPEHWSDNVEWARFTGSIEVSTRPLSYRQIDVVVKAFRRTADSLGLRLKVFDQVDSGNEFVREYFKLSDHTECFSQQFQSYDIRGLLRSDTIGYAAAPSGIADGMDCGTFLVDQVARYVHDLGFDGILYGNQLGTRGRWLPGDGPGYSDAEASAIRSFMSYSKQKLAGRDLMWFDSYNNARVEHDTWSVPSDTYDNFDYLIAAGFCVITYPDRYLDNLRSKLRIRGRMKVLATLDYVDPWYKYNSMNAFDEESRTLEAIAILYRYDIDGFVFFANDEQGQLVPARIISSFAQRFFSAN